VTRAHAAAAATFPLALNIALVASTVSRAMPTVNTTPKIAVGGPNIAIDASHARSHADAHRITRPETPMMKTFE
jgi:hypothetical protein